MLSNEDLQLITGKVEGSLSEAEAQLFQEKYATDSEFKKEAIAQTQVLAGIEALEKKALKDEFASWLNSEEVPNTTTQETETITDTPAAKTRTINWPLYAAAAIVPLLIAFIFLLSPDQKTAEELFADNYQPLENITGARRGGTDDPVNRGMQYYEAGDYTTAITFFEQSEKEDSLISIYLGISYLATGETAEAKQVFEAVIDGGNKVLSATATWYLALTHLKEKNYPKTQEKLQLLIDSQSADYAEDALKLFKEIEALK